MTSSLVRAFGCGLLLFARLSILHLGVGLARADTSSDSGDVLVCSGSVPVGKIHSGGYYPIGSESSSATGSCACKAPTGDVACSRSPNSPILIPQGPAVCQAKGRTTCAGGDVILCADRKPIGGLNSQGRAYVTGRSDDATGYCQCGSAAPWDLACPDNPTSQSWSQFQNRPIKCSKDRNCAGFA